MTNHRDTAKHFLTLGLNPISIVQGGKYPSKGFTDFNNHRTTNEDINKFDFSSIAVSTGYISKNLEAIDIDLKNAKDGKTFMNEFRSRISNSLLKKLIIQQTPSGGYHLIYRCLTISSSKKIARNPEGEAIIETRGEGGFIVVAPSDGYKLLRGSFDKIPYLDESERFELFIESQKLDQCFLKTARKRFSKDDLIGFKKFPNYNNDENIAVELLEKHGWKKLERNDPQWISFTRPNTKSGDNHAGYHKEGKFLNVFSTSQETFEIGRPYNNHAIYAELEHEGNYPKAYAKLYEMGFGVEVEEITEEEENKQQFKNNIDKILFLSDEIDEFSYLDQASKGLIPQGLTWGWRALDPFTRAKPNSLNMFIGFDNVGKSALTLSLATATNILHDWKWGMIMPENRNCVNRKRLIEIETGKRIGYFGDKSVLLKQLWEKSRENFKIIKNEKHYSLSEVIEMGRKLYEFYGINALLIDPYNFFKVTSDNQYALNNQLLSELRVFAEKYCSVYLIGHPSTQAARKEDNQGFVKIPSKYDAQGGIDFANRVDDFGVLHRITKHPEPEVYRTMQIKVDKVKDTDTGGQQHSEGDYTGLIYETRNGFLGYWDENDDNPMYRAKMAKLDVSEDLPKIKKMKPEDVF